MIPSIGLSIDHASVTVFTRSPVVNIIRRVPRTLCQVRQRTDVSDHHSVDSHALSMMRTASVYVVSPKLLPCTVTLATTLFVLKGVVAGFVLHVVNQVQAGRTTVQLANVVQCQNLVLH